MLLFCVWYEPRELGGRGSSNFSCVTPVVETFSDRVAFCIQSDNSDGACLQKQQTALTLISRCQAFSYNNWHLSSFPSVPCFPFCSLNESYLHFRLSDILYICQYLFIETQKQSSGGVLEKRCSQKFSKIHRKTPVPESASGNFTITD